MKMNAIFRKGLVALAFLLGLFQMGWAQGAVETLTADVTRTKHNVAIVEDVKDSGKFYFKRPDKMAIVFNENDRLLMEGSTYTMVVDGKASVAKSKMADLFGLLQQVLQRVMSGEEVAGISGTADFKVEREGNEIRILPAKEGKVSRRMLFTGFTLTLDAKTSRLMSLRMNERGENYTRYDLSNHAVNAAVGDTVFLTSGAK